MTENADTQVPSWARKAVAVLLPHVSLDTAVYLSDPSELPIGEEMAEILAVWEGLLLVCRVARPPKEPTSQPADLRYTVMIRAVPVHRARSVSWDAEAYIAKDGPTDHRSPKVVTRLDDANDLPEPLSPVITVRDEVHDTGVRNLGNELLSALASRTRVARTTPDVPG